MKTHTLANQLQPDEFLNSFLLRQVIMAEQTTARNLQTIITTSWTWYLLPKVPVHLRYVFSRLAFSEKQDLVIRGTNIWWIEFSNDPTMQSRATSAIFHGGEFPTQHPRATRWTTPMIYCPECFREQMEDTGFVWFKRSWALFDYCQTHKRNLQYGGCHQCAKSSSFPKTISATLTGRCPDCKDDTWLSINAKKAQYSFEFTTNIEREFDLKPDHSTMLAPCLVTALLADVSDELMAIILSPGWRSDLSYRTLIRDYDYLTRTEVPTQVKEYAILKFLHQHFAGRIDAFIASYGEFVTIDKRIHELGDCKFPYITSKDRSCSNCSVDTYFCPLKSQI